MAGPAKQQSRITRRTRAGQLRSTSARWSQGKPLIFGRSGRVEVTVKQSSPTVESTPWPT